MDTKITSLTPVERLLLLNQFEIRKRLEESDEYDSIIEALSQGYAGAYQRAFNLLQDGVSAEDCAFVNDVLAMHRTIFDWDDKNGGEFAEEKFDGFDGNADEGALGYFARHEIARRGQWDSLKNRKAFPDCNSHCPMRESYEKMLKVWKPIYKKGWDALTREDIVSILDAGRSKLAP